MGQGKALYNLVPAAGVLWALLEDTSKCRAWGSHHREDIWPVPPQEALQGSGQAEGTTLHCEPSGSGAGAEREFICMASAPCGPTLIQVLPAFPLYCLVNV